MPLPPLCLTQTHQTHQAHKTSQAKNSSSHTFLARIPASIERLTKSIMGYNELIPGLPEEVARECLIRVGFEQLPVVRRISRQWKTEVESPAYNRLRKAEGLGRPALALVQARPELTEAGPAHKQSSAGGGQGNSYRMVLLDPVEGRWTPLPELPGAGGSLPLFCQVAAVDGGEGRKRLMVVGGWDPETWAPTDSVFVYDFLTGAWRLGAGMPGPRRSFFACAAVGAKVFVAGGHDEEKNALRSALAYDPDADAWATLPDMAEERDEPRGLCVGGKFLVVGGYPTPAQGRFVGSAESFDPATSTWSLVQEGLVDDGASPRTCSAAPGAVDRMYMLRDGHLVARHGATSASAAWRPVAPVPEDARTAAVVSAIPDGRVVVIGSGCHGGDQTVYTLREEAGKPASWARAPAPPEFAGHVQAACLLEI